MFSAVHPTTDIAKILRHVRFVPISDIARRPRGAYFSRREQLAGENIDEVHLTDDDKPLD
jgi:hypothetical protein